MKKNTYYTWWTIQTLTKPSNSTTFNKRKKKKKKKNPKKQRPRQTWLTSCWGWRRGSVRERALELELRGSWFFLELGYLSEAERSKGREPLCCCCKMMVAAAARACSWIKASSTNFSFRDDRIRVHLLLELEDTVAAVLFALASLFVAFLLFTGLGARQPHRLPIEAAACKSRTEQNKTKHRDKEYEEEGKEVLNILVGKVQEHIEKGRSQEGTEQRERESGVGVLERRTALGTLDLRVKALYRVHSVPWSQRWSLAFAV